MENYMIKIEFYGGVLMEDKKNDIHKYTNEELLEQLRYHYSKNSKITMESFLEDKEVSSPTTVAGRFGSWKNALKEAGLPERTIFTKEKVINTIQEYYEQALDISFKNFEREKRFCSIVTIRKLFGSWENALRESGINKNYSKEDLIKFIQDYYRKKSDVRYYNFRKKKNSCSMYMIKKYFGTWRNALKESGIKYKDTYTKEEVLEEIRDFNKKTKSLNCKKFHRDKRYCSQATVRRLFGNWGNALLEAGLRDKVKDYVEYDKDKLLEILKMKVKTGELKYSVDIEKIKGIPGLKYVTGLWSWKELSELLGLKRRPASYTKKEIEDIYKKLSENYPRMTIKMFKEIGGISVTSIIIRYGSWNNFLRKMKAPFIQEVKKVKHTKEELIKMYREYSIKIGEDVYGATEQDLNDGFIYKKNTLISRFGSMNDLRREAGFVVKNETYNKYTKEKIKTELYKEYKKKRRKLNNEEIKKNERLPGVSTIMRKLQVTGMAQVWEEVLKK